jgi:hypothetical protein
MDRYTVVNSFKFTNTYSIPISFPKIPVESTLWYFLLLSHLQTGHGILYVGLYCFQCSDWHQCCILNALFITCHVNLESFFQTPAKLCVNQALMDFEMKWFPSLWKLFNLFPNWSPCGCLPCSHILIIAK